MSVMTIERAYTPHGTFGVLRYKTLEIATVERNWLNNEPNVSCIPEGTYKIGLTHFGIGGYDTLEVEGVAGRTYIKFHKGNWPESVQGCIAVGLCAGVLSDRWAVLHSQQAFDKFWAAVKDDPPRTIQITGHQGTIMEAA